VQEAALALQVTPVELYLYLYMYIYLCTYVTCVEVLELECGGAGGSEVEDAAA
jgi:hypothetical protein